MPARKKIVHHGPKALIYDKANFNNESSFLQHRRMLYMLETTRRLVDETQQLLPDPLDVKDAILLSQEPMMLLLTRQDSSLVAVALAHAVSTALQDHRLQDSVTYATRGVRGWPRLFTAFVKLAHAIEDGTFAEHNI